MAGTGWWAEVDGDGCKVRDGERFRLCELVGSATATAVMLGGGVGVLAAFTGG